METVRSLRERRNNNSNFNPGPRWNLKKLILTAAGALALAVVALVFLSNRTGSPPLHPPIPTTTPTTSAISSPSESPCAAYKTYGTFNGKSVQVFTSILAPEDALYEKSYEEFEECTGITIKYEGSNDFEAALKVRVDGGNAPDLAYVPQPGLLANLVKQGAVKEAPEDRLRPR